MLASTAIALPLCVDMRDTVSRFFSNKENLAWVNLTRADFSPENFTIPNVDCCEDCTKFSSRFWCLSTERCYEEGFLSEWEVLRMCPWPEIRRMDQCWQTFETMTWISLAVVAPAILVGVCSLIRWATKEYFHRYPAETRSMST